MKILLTGHRGYIGAEMVPALLAAGHEVTGLDTGLYDDCDFLLPLESIPELRVDLRDVEEHHLAGFDAVAHLAALSNDPLGDLNSELTYDINLHASVKLARAAKAAGVERFLFASSCSLYGAGGGDLLDESAAFFPQTPYGESKVRVEQELSRLADASFSPVYFRNATAYGVSRRLRLDIVVNNLTGIAMTSGKVLLQSDGTAWRPLVHIQDIIQAFVAVLRAPREDVHNQAFNVGSTQENYRIREVAELVAQVVPKAEVRYTEGASADTRNYRVNFDKLPRTIPSYAPRWTVKRGIEELYEAYLRLPMTAELFNGPRYFRLRTVNQLRARGALDDALRRTTS